VYVHIDLGSPIFGDLTWQKVPREIGHNVEHDALMAEQAVMRVISGLKIARLNRE
jgi:hypothetical protein